MLQTVGVEGITQFPRVGGADGGDRVGAQKRRLHHVHRPVLLQYAGIPPAAIQTQHVLHGALMHPALIFDIMHRVNAADAAVVVHTAGVVFQIHRQKRRLPVVTVDDIRLVVQIRQEICHGAAEEGEPLTVVRLAVKLPAAEIPLVIQKIPGNALFRQGEESAVLVAPRQIYVHVFAKRHPGTPRLADGTVERQYDRHAVAFLLRQRHGQTACHVRQTAGLAKGRRFTGGKQNIHTVTPRCFWRSPADSSHAPSAYRSP